MTGDVAPIARYDPEDPRDHYAFRNTLTRLIIWQLTRTQPFRPELVDGAWWLATRLEHTARTTRPS